MSRPGPHGPAPPDAREGPADPPGASRSVRTALVVGPVLVGTALWLDLSVVHAHHQADSLLPALVSLQAWTPFYWGQERLGMLGPLLAMPVRHPFWNLLVQDGLYVLAGLAVPFLLARTLLPRGRRVAAGAAGAGLLLVGLSSFQQFHWFIGHHEYGLSLALGLLGVVVLEGEGAPGVLRAAGGGLLLAVGQWVNVSLAFVLGPLVACRALLRVAEGEASTRDADDGALARLLDPGTLWTLGLLGAGFAANLLLAEWWGPAEYGLLPVARWPAAWVALATNAAGTWVRAGPILLVATVASLGLLLGGGTGEREELGPVLRRVAPLLAAAGVYLLLIGTIGHVARNDHDARYLFPGLALLATAVPAVPLGLLRAGRPRAHEVTGWVLLAALPLLVGVVHGRPDPGAVRNALDERFAAPARQAVDAGCTHVLGDYWSVWPTVFQAELIRHERGRPDDPVWGIAHRGRETEEAWEGMDPREMRIAVLRTDDPAEVERQRRAYDLPELERVERRDEIDVYVPRPE